MADIPKMDSRQYNRYQYILENIKDVIWELDPNLVITFISPNSLEMSGYRAEEMIGHRVSEFLTNESKKYFRQNIYPVLRKRKKGDAGGTVLHEVQFICKNGTVIWIEASYNPLFENGKFNGYIGTTRNIMEKKENEYRLNQYIEELRKLNAELKKTAVTDTLTGIFNRRKFDEDLNQLIDRQEKREDQFSLLLFDIDRFKVINDNYGHKKGDFVLQRITELVSQNIRMTDHFFRWGGEEFMIILSGSNLTNAIKIAEKIRSIIAEENFGFERPVTISFGVGEFQEEENAEQLIARVDKLLYQAKIQGGNIVIG